MNTIESSYKEIAPLKGYPGAHLVLHKDTGKIYVKKCLEIYHTEIYQQLTMLHNIHIPKIYAYEEQENRLFLIEEYISGQTLMEQISHGTLFSEEDTIDIALQICDALTCLHSLHPPIIHRDIKLSNVMCTEDGIIKLIDYNIARCYTEGTSQDTTLLGTPAYAAPEQFGFSQTDARTDMYSLGVMINYMLTGESHKTFLYSGSKSITQIIRRCTCMEPKKRYQTVSELSKALKKCQKSHPEHTLSKLLPLPGFRTRKLWKMFLAVCIYLMLFFILYDLEFTAYQGMPSITILSRITTGLWCFFIIALFTNYADIQKQFPLVAHSNILIRLLGIFLFGFLGLFFNVMISDLFAFLIYR